VLPFKRGEHEAPLADDEVEGEAEGEADEAGAPRKRELVVLREFRQWIADQQQALDDWQKRVDGKIRTAIGSVSPFSGLHKDVRALADRIAELEAKLQAIADAEGSER
jgi:hypothetical protein